MPFVLSLPDSDRRYGRSALTNLKVTYFSLCPRTLSHLSPKVRTLACLTTNGGSETPIGRPPEILH